VATLKRAIALNPEDTDTAALLGAYLNEIGRRRGEPGGAGGVRGTEESRSRRPHGPRRALAQIGRTEDAIATFDRALAIDPSNAAAKANLGTVSMGVRDYARARTILEESLALDPDVSRAHNALGVIAAETGHPDEAIVHWKRAVELNPREWDTLFNLGKLLRRQGREKEARPYVERFIREAPSSQYAADIRTLRASLPVDN
jgi:tetratricopeptide (TPR) repeat protein